MALSSDAHRPEDVGADYEQALELLRPRACGELCVFERRAARGLEPSGARMAVADEPRAASATTRTAWPRAAG